MAGYIGSTPVPQGIQEQQSFTATAGQTTFNTLGYTDGNTIRVTLNGVLLEGAGVDYTASNGSDIVLTAAASADDILTFETFNEFQLVSQTMTTPTISGGTLKSNVTLKNDTEQDTDGGRASKIIYQGEQSGGEISTLAEIQASHDGTADDEKGDLIFRTNDGSDGTSPTEAMRITSAQKIGLGNNDPNAKLDVSEVNNTSSLVSARYNSSNRKIGFNANNSNGQGFLAFNSNSVSGSANQTYDINGVAAKIDYAGDMTFDLAASGTAGNTITYSEKMRILASGGITFNGDTAAENALNDYEIGTFTPVLKSGSSTVTTTNPVGQYVKTGRMVLIQGSLQRNDSAGHNQIVGIQGLPYVREQITYLTAMGTGWAWLDLGTGADQIMMAYHASNQIQWVMDSRVVNTRYLYANSITNSRYFYFCSAYRANA